MHTHTYSKSWHTNTSTLPYDGNLCKVSLRLFFSTIIFIGTFVPHSHCLAVICAVETQSPFSHSGFQDDPKGWGHVWQTPADSLLSSDP